MMSIRHNILVDIELERDRQTNKWTGIFEDSKWSAFDWHEMISDYNAWARRMASMGSLDKARNRYIQIAALAVAAIEQIDQGTYANTSS